MAAPDQLQVITNAAAMRQFTRQHRAAGRTVAFVPTMGNLHAGHLALVEAGRQQADVVVASIYVNPTQFAQNEDFDEYPRQREADRKMLQDAGCSAVFEPPSLYASPSERSESSAVVGRADHIMGAHETFIQVEQLQRGLCGKSRPTFFRGVATVVAKLFNIVEPDVALFGKKDYQQWRVLQRMARDLDFDIKIVGCAIVRHQDGLAMSSRNDMLTAEDRAAAPCIQQALQWAAAAAASDQPPTSEALQAGVADRLTHGGGRVDYVEIVDAEELQPVTALQSQPVLIAVAAWFGEVRLIDNVVIGTASQ
mmetsp:Transcript_6539/g.18859  ORF Transcript_6539/g.18859 Transcript_6539/m.18859 type:complete len:309 (-) Transcript_6539:2079-3005(-)|eukprot:CAMPEP_0206140908 /NCGR_PEP_ID=MMETSP1473-20131121/11093_1 /ASSEMBLY_ACC=CAM_ASM_001109 /TAXON_ID=1461547 /ORGANISM="Stichococcus sp, Strain RCC1054" /LENGTH=308 /DNA_ID=CAMNT_0053535253 /DNA_START=42 /DNA_END=968 /DNA_ORIENTATION=-